MWTGTYGNACSWTCPRCPRADWLPPARRRRTHRPCMSPNAPRDRPAARANVLTLVMHMTDTPALRTLLAEKGLPVPPSIASSDEVAEIGLARLPHGPVHNWGLDDDAAGWACGRDFRLWSGQPAAADCWHQVDFAAGNAPCGRSFGDWPESRLPRRVLSRAGTAVCTFRPDAAVRQRSSQAPRRVLAERLLAGSRSWRWTTSRVGRC